MINWCRYCSCCVEKSECEGCCDGFHGVEGDEGDEGEVAGVEYEEYEHVDDCEIGVGVVASTMSCGNRSRAWAKSWRLCLEGSCAKYGFVYMVWIVLLDSKCGW